MTAASLVPDSSSEVQQPTFLESVFPIRQAAKPRTGGYQADRWIWRRRLHTQPCTQRWISNSSYARDTCAEARVRPRRRPYFFPNYLYPKNNPRRRAATMAGYGQGPLPTSRRQLTTAAAAALLLINLHAPAAATPFPPHASPCLSPYLRTTLSPPHSRVIPCLVSRQGTAISSSGSLPTLPLAFFPHLLSSTMVDRKLSDWSVGGGSPR